MNFQDKIRQFQAWDLILLFLQADQLAYYCFMDAGTRHEISGSETKDCVTYGTASSINISIFASISPCPQVPWG